VQERLREGVEAARRGDKLTARRLLQQVLIQDRNNEAALMWMASVMDTVAERRAYLERALQINPNNDRAREALNRLGGPSRSAAPSVGSTSRRVGSRSTYLIAAGVVAALMVLIVVVSLLSAPPPPDPVESTFAAVLRGTDTPIPTRPVPTPTFFGIIVTSDSSMVELPPTFTPTNTLPPTETLVPSATPLPIQSFAAIYSDFEPRLAQPSLFGVFDDEGEASMSESGFYDIAVSPDGELLAFVRLLDVAALESEATEEGGVGGNPQLFVTSPDDVENVRQLTEMSGSNMAHPSWSSNGEQIVFASNQDGDEELYIVGSNGGRVEQLTDNDAIDTSPEFSPDGSLIVYTSDADSPGFTEVYTYAAENGAIARLTDDSGNNYAPSWSPDGSRIAYVSDKSGDGDIYVMDSDGSRAFLITPDDRGAEDRSPTWSPDGRWIAFASNRDGENFRWYAVNLETREVVPLTTNEIRNAQSLIFLPG
jgi:Tol biopolymer transport system component